MSWHPCGSFQSQVVGVTVSGCGMRLLGDCGTGEGAVVPWQGSCLVSSGSCSRRWCSVGCLFRWWVCIAVGREGALLGG
jgi:hypothetical protein